MFMRSLRACLVFAACSRSGVVTPERNPIVAQHADLDRAEAQWLASGSTITGMTSGLQRVVRGFTPRRGTQRYVRSATLLRGNTQSARVRPNGTELFAAIRQGMASGSDVRVSYDGVLGYPVHIDIPIRQGWPMPSGARTSATFCRWRRRDELTDHKRKCICGRGSKACRVVQSARFRGRSSREVPR